ncbi:MAG: hypothetical protein F4Z50_11015, partial [Gemmatimonadetes bacterium]|nr:hypothetical protein [Gemmatimonadota bacterium]
MKKTLATLVFLLAAASACVDPLPTDPIEESGFPADAVRHDMIGVPVVYRGQAAIDHYSKVLRSELASPRLLELNARLKGMTVAKYGPGTETANASTPRPGPRAGPGAAAPQGD